MDPPKRADALAAALARGAVSRGCAAAADILRDRAAEASLAAGALIDLRSGLALRAGQRPGALGAVMQCPHPGCDQRVVIAQINCGIFRHGAQLVAGVVGAQIPPHASRAVCERVVREGGAGCGRPFRIGASGGELRVVACGYDT